MTKYKKLYPEYEIPLKYIGRDGDLGLIKNKIYYVKLFIKYGKIIVQWSDNCCCPYDTLNSLYNNWRSY